MPDLLAYVDAGALAGLFWPFIAILLTIGTGFAIAFIWRRSEEFALAAALATSAALVIAIAFRPAVAVPPDDGRAFRVAAVTQANSADQVNRAHAR
jgi:hypothetical protein